MILATLGLAACTDGGPEPETRELVEEPPRPEAHAGFEHQPECERLVDPRNFSSASCMCDDDSHFARIELSSELLEASERRSTKAFAAAKQARLEVEDSD